MIQQNITIFLGVIGVNYATWKPGDGKAATVQL